MTGDLSDVLARLSQLEEQVRVTQTVPYKSNALPVSTATTTTNNITVENPFTITHITPVTVASGNAGAVAWSPLDVSASVPVATRYVVVTCYGTDEVGVAGDTYIKFRQASGSPELVGLYCFINAGVGDVSGTNTRIIPVTGQSFDYSLNLGFTNGWEIILEGYIL